MKLKPDFILPYPPILHVSSLDDGEARIVRSIGDNLIEMKHQYDRIVTDVSLFNFCRINPEGTLGEWIFLAGRDGAMALRNFSEALSAVRSLVGRCDSVVKYVNVSYLKESEKLFQKSFPQIEKLRHAVAHPELYANPDVKMSTDTAINMSGVKMQAGVTIKESLFDNTFVSTINGLTVQYDLNIISVNILLKVAYDVFLEFAKVDAADTLRGSWPH